MTQHAAKERATARVHANHFPASVNLGNLDFVGDDQPATNQVDEIARQEVFGQQEFTGSAFETAEVDTLTLEGHAALSESPDFANRNEGVTALDLDNGPDNGWVSVIAEARNEVLHPSDTSAILVVDRAS